MLILRSLAFNVAFYINITLWMVICLPTLLMPKSLVWKVVTGWSRSNHWLLKVIAGINFELRGGERLEKGGLIIASKHQSAWETVSVFNLFHHPAFILKRELMWIPMFGWFAFKLDMIPIDRRKGSATLKLMTERATDEIAHNRQILIYPEGTRRAAGAPPDYKFGVARLYNDLNATVLPVAHNAGVFWPRRTFLRYPGTVVMEVLEPIATGLDMRTFHNLMVERIETASNRLIEEAAAAANPSPIALRARDDIRARAAEAEAAGQAEG